MALLGLICKKLEIKFNLNEYDTRLTTTSIAAAKLLPNSRRNVDPVNITIKGWRQNPPPLLHYCIGTGTIFARALNSLNSAVGMESDPISVSVNTFQLVWSLAAVVPGLTVYRNNNFIYTSRNFSAPNNIYPGILLGM